MKFTTFCNIVSCVVTVISANTLFAANPEKTYCKLIEKYDVADTVLNAPSAEAFWTLLQLTDNEYRKTYKSINSKGDKDIKRDMEDLITNSDFYFRNVPTDPSLYALAEHMIDFSGIRAVNPLAILTITEEPDIAMWGYPNGYLFFTHPMLRELGNDSIAAQAILTAEAAHYVLQHAYAHAKWEKSRKKRGLWGKILGVIASVTAGYVLEEMSDGYFPGVEFGTTVAIAIAYSETPQRYQMLYTPDQIYQADIIAYRFMEWCGYGGQTYISALEKVGYDLDATQAYSKDNPTIVSRLGLLRYLAANSTALRPKVKAKNRKPKPLPRTR